MEHTHKTFLLAFSLLSCGVPVENLRVKETKQDEEIKQNEQKNLDDKCLYLKQISNSNSFYLHTLTSSKETDRLEKETDRLEKDSSITVKYDSKTITLVKDENQTSDFDISKDQNTPLKTNNQNVEPKKFYLRLQNDHGD